MTPSAHKRSPAGKPPLERTEFIALMAWLMAMTALSIDIMLPALPAIGAELGAAASNDRQLVVTSYLGGLALGQLLWGPLSDRHGRRLPLLAGLAVFVIGGIAAVLAPSFALLLMARALQGFGGAAARTIGTAIVRDAFEGRAMARIMSFVMTVFILVPMLAPSAGQVLLQLGTWRVNFVVLLAWGALALLWVGIRLPETRTSLGTGEMRPSFLAGLRAVAGNRVTLGYGIASGFLFGCLVAYISSAQQVFVDHFQLGAWFPLAFGGVAGAMALAAMTNARLVQRLGMRRLSHTAIATFVVLGLLLVTVCLQAHPPLVLVGPMLAGCFFLFGIAMPNLTAIALQPVGHFAGLASSLIGAYTTAAGVLFGGMIGRSFDGTPLPLALGFAMLSICAFLTILAVEGRRGLFRGE